MLIINILQEKFCMLKDKIKLYNQRDFLNIPCASCGKAKHQIDKCTLINYVPNKSIVIQNYKQMNYQPRRTRTRSVKKTKKALSQIEKLMKTSKLIEIKYPEFADIFSDCEDSSKRQSMEFSKKLMSLDKQESYEFHNNEISEKALSDEIVRFPKEKNSIFNDFSSAVMDANNNKIANRPIIRQTKRNPTLLKEKSPVKIDELINFENARNYKHYFPKNNITEIIRLNSLNRQIILSPKLKPNPKKKKAKILLPKNQ